MSSVRIVCEGPTDYDLIKAILTHINPDLVVTLIQPEADGLHGNAGPHGGGWKGVRGWCHTIRDHGGLSTSGALANVQALILHVDADIATDPEINCAQKCPPAQPTTTALGALICAQWLGETPPKKLILCIPAQSTELWIWAALFPSELQQQVNPECMPEPAAKLTHRDGKFVQRKDGSYKKNRKGYQNAGPQIALAWDQVTATIPEARRFDQSLRHALTLSSDD